MHARLCLLSSQDEESASQRRRRRRRLGGSALRFTTSQLRSLTWFLSISKLVICLLTLVVGITTTLGPKVEVKFCSAFQKTW